MTEKIERTVSEEAAAEAFAREAEQKSTGLLQEYWDFLRNNKKWWLTPIIVALLLVGVLIILGSTAAAPFIYTLF
ncbi:MAG: DUF5989 family protein [Planctomycetota bacterium]|jgi:hypothetical protein